MVTRTKNPDSDSTSSRPRPDLSGTVRESAQQIWLAGLGAFAKAQQEGSKVFDSLVKEGVSMQHKTQTAAGEKLSEATSRINTLASDLSSRASGQWDKLETIFEGRVSKALNKLGVPTAEDMKILSARIEELNRHLSTLTPKSAATRSAAAKGKPGTAASGTSTAAKRKPAKKVP